MPDPLLRQPVHVPDHVEGLGLTVVDPEAVLDDLLLPGAQDAQELAHLLPHHHPVHDQVGGLDVRIFRDLLQC